LYFALGYYHNDASLFHVATLLQEKEKYCDEYVCLSICLSVHLHNSRTTWPNFLHDARGSVLIWQRCNMLWCTSGFV